MGDSPRKAMMSGFCSIYFQSERQLKANKLIYRRVSPRAGPFATISIATRKTRHLYKFFFLRARLVPKNFHLEICDSPFGHVYGVLNVVKQQN